MIPYKGFENIFLWFDLPLAILLVYILAPVNYIIKGEFQKNIKAARSFIRGLFFYDLDLTN